MKDSEFQACMDGLGLLQGEEIYLKHVCFRELVSTSWDGKPRKNTKKGLLVFTDDNMIFMEQSGAWSSNYTQALRIPLEQIIGISCGGMIVKSLDITVSSGGTHVHKFSVWQDCQESSSPKDNALALTEKIQILLQSVRNERKKIAQEALNKGTVPTMIFCRYCGTRNKSDASFCINCKAPLK